MGRVVGEDYSPCADGQTAYSLPNLATGEGLEVINRYDTYENGQLATDASFIDTPEAAKGRLVSTRDRGSVTRFNYDPHGNARRVSRRIARPFNEPGGDGYATDWHIQRTDVDQADRIKRKTTGVTLPAFLVNGESQETRTYKHRGMLAGIGSSYGPLTRLMAYEADGQPSSIELSDAARTTMTFQYDARRRLEHFTASRSAAPPVWSTASTNYSLPPPDTTQLVLTDLTFTLDKVGNPKRIEDTSTSYWAPGHATTKARNAQYDDLYRLTWIEHDYGTDNLQRSPFRA